MTASKRQHSGHCLHGGRQPFLSLWLFVLSTRLQGISSSRPPSLEADGASVNSSHERQSSRPAAALQRSAAEFQEGKPVIRERTGRGRPVLLNLEESGKKPCGKEEEEEEEEEPPKKPCEAPPKKPCEQQEHKDDLEALRERVEHASQQKQSIEQMLQDLAGKTAEAKEIKEQLERNLPQWIADRDSTKEKLEEMKKGEQHAMQDIEQTQATALAAGKSASTGGDPSPQAGSALALQVSSGGRTLGELARGVGVEHKKKVVKRHRMAQTSSDIEALAGPLQDESEIFVDQVNESETRMRLLVKRIAAGQQAKERLENYYKEAEQHKEVLETQLEKADEELKKAMQALKDASPPPPPTKPPAAHQPCPAM